MIAALVMARAAVIVRDRDFVAVCGVGLVLSVSSTVKLEVAAAVGVPEIVPLGASERPDGSVPLARDQAYGVVPPEPASAWEYEVPAVPVGSDVVEIESAGLTLRV